MSADHWMRFNIGDYLADTMNLSTMQHGAYILLIMHYFKRGGLPKEESALARIAKIPTRQWRLHGDPVMALFKHDESGLWRHKRIDAERARIQGKDGRTHARGSPGVSSRAGASPGDPPERAVPEPKLKLIRGRAFARPPTHGGFSHNIAARRAAGDD